MIKQLIFDCDGVLVDSEILATRVLLKKLYAHGFEFEEKDFIQTFTGQQTSQILTNLFTQKGKEAPEGFVEEVDKGMWQVMESELEPIKQVKNTLTQMSLPKAVVSNSTLPWVQRSLKVADIHHLFDEKLFVANMVENPKPAPDVYLFAAEKLKVQPEECLVVEDSPSGATAALSAGMKVIGFLGASHILDGHDEKLMDRGVEHLAKDMDELLLRVNELVN
ncbi:HAD family hydrolase [Rapidithrix thailandica]|uniref:HAD family hydrolase n=1 Tax=Rapidithrix thailandica TaxID=413964 RepID=A0AAW9S231_9BACT